MSHVTNILLLTAREDHDARLIELGFQKVDGYAGGNKSMESDVWAAAFNHFDLDVLMAELRDIQWEYPEEVQLLVKDEHDERFSELDIGLLDKEV